MVTSQPGELVPTDLPFAAEIPSLADPLLDELYRTAEAESLGLTHLELSDALLRVGQKFTWNLPSELAVSNHQKESFYRALRLPDLALAQACALGREAAWERFLTLYRAPLTQAAIAITGSATVGHDLADSLYAELYGLSTKDGDRRCPLSSYSGRGSLLGWLRTTLAQRHIDQYRRTHRETPLDTSDNANMAVAPPALAEPLPAELGRLTSALSRTLAAIRPEDRFLLSAYFLDRQTLLQIARLLHVHEATVSRKLKRLTGDLRKQLLRNLQAGGLSKRAAEEALGIDPRDLEINLRALLQTSHSPPFSDQKIGEDIVTAQP